MLLNLLLLLLLCILLIERLFVHEYCATTWLSIICVLLLHFHGPSPDQVLIVIRLIEVLHLKQIIVPIPLALFVTQILVYLLPLWISPVPCSPLLILLLIIIPYEVESL